MNLWSDPSESDPSESDPSENDPSESDPSESDPSGRLTRCASEVQRAPTEESKASTVR